MNSKLPVVKYCQLFCVLITAVIVSSCALAPYENPYSSVDYKSDHVNLAIRPKYESIAIMPFYNDSDYPHAADFARKSFVGALSSYTHYDLQSVTKTDKILEKLPRGVQRPEEYKTLANTLRTDLIAFGHVKKQRHSYGLVYAITEVRVRIVLIDAYTGAIVWRAEDTRKRRTGGIDPYALIVTYHTEHMWAREILNRYDELFRDMMIVLPDRMAGIID